MLKSLSRRGLSTDYLRDDISVNFLLCPQDLVSTIRAIAGVDYPCALQGLIHSRLLTAKQ